MGDKPSRVFDMKVRQHDSEGKSVLTVKLGVVSFWDKPDGTSTGRGQMFTLSGRLVEFTLTEQTDRKPSKRVDISTIPIVKETPFG